MHGHLMQSKIRIMHGVWMKNGNFYSVLSGQIHIARNYLS